MIPPSRFYEYGSDRFVAAFRDKSNWQPACAMCNAKKGGGGPLENHTGGMTVVCGPPNSGKNTYVERHADADDLVWDLDALAAAMNPRWKRHVDRPDDVAALLLELRTCVVETVRRGGLNRTCWIIISNEDVAKRVASPLGATLVRCPIGGKE